MKERLKCCFYILFAKQYAVYTADVKCKGKYVSCHIKYKQKAFLETIASFTKTLINKEKEDNK